MPEDYQAAELVECNHKVVKETVLAEYPGHLGRQFGEANQRLIADGANVKTQLPVTRGLLVARGAAEAIGRSRAQVQSQRRCDLVPKNGVVRTRVYQCQ